MNCPQFPAILALSFQMAFVELSTGSRALGERRESEQTERKGGREESGGAQAQKMGQLQANG